MSACFGIDLDAGLARLGLACFRPGQREAVETLLERARLLLVAPTGGGKSLVYQLPASLLPGTSLVISPLVSLMQDQVQALAARGVPATFLASTLSAAEMRERLARLREGSLKLAYVAPERLAFPGFRATAQALQPPLVAVDEAHCISEWGHDFRPEYLQIGAFVEELRPRYLLACTATATPIVRDEILARLRLPADTPQLLRGFARPNLALRAREAGSPSERARHVDALLGEAIGRPGAARGAVIVYAPTRRAAESEATRLTSRGFRADAYHAGMNGDERTRVQQAFSGGSLEIVAATNAFGMGIDRADVRAVVHLAPPGSIEAYYQEVGRAGRDGSPAIGLLLHSPSDLALRRRLLEAGGESSADPRVVEHKWGLFLELMRWIEGGSCRHDAILRYFGDEAETLHGCGRCDVCTDLDGGDAPSEAEATLVVRKALSGVARVHDRFGLGAAVKLLRGAADPRLARARLDATSTFGILSGHSEEWLTRVLRRCVSAGFVDFTTGDRPLVRLTDEGRAVMKAERTPRLLLPRERGHGLTSPAPAAPSRKRAEGSEALPPEALGLFGTLRLLRLELAREEGVPAFVVASDRTLRDIALLRPATREALLRAHGIGPAKADRYGARLLAAVARAAGPA